MTRMRDESGFTLVELLVSMSVGMVVLFGIFGLVDTSVSLSSKTADRVDTTARARLAIFDITRQVRSQICLGTKLPALTVGTDNSMTFYASLAPEQAGAAGKTPPLVVQQRRLTYRPAPDNDIYEEVWTGTGTRPDVTFPAAPSRTRVLASGIQPNGSTPIFRYYRFQVTPPDTVARPKLITTTPLVEADLARTVQIDVNFTAIGRKATTQVDMGSSVFVRTSSPTNPNNSPLCL